MRARRLVAGALVAVAVLPACATNRAGQNLRTRHDNVDEKLVVAQALLLEELAGRSHGA